MPCAGQYTYRLGNLLSAVAFHVLAVSANCDAVYLLNYAKYFSAEKGAVVISAEVIDCTLN